MPTQKDRGPSKSGIAHLIRRAMALDDPCALVLTNGDRIIGPIRRLWIDKQIKPAKNNSTLVATTLGGHDAWVNDVADVTLADGQPLPADAPDPGEYWR